MRLLRVDGVVALSPARVREPPVTELVREPAVSADLQQTRRMLDENRSRLDGRILD